MQAFKPISGWAEYLGQIAIVGCLFGERLQRAASEGLKKLRLANCAWFSILGLFAATTAKGADLDYKEQLASFIQSPPPIREMVVECDWYQPTATNEMWITLCWQTNAYILRSSQQQVGLWDRFDPDNLREVIGVRAGDDYSLVSYYKVLGVHIKRVHGLQNPTARDIVTPMVLGQQDQCNIALTAGIPLGPPGGAVRTGDTFTFRNNVYGTTAVAVMRAGETDFIQAFDWTNEADKTASSGATKIFGPIRYIYGGSAQPAWFPHEIIRDLIVNGSQRTICRFIVHRLELGVVPLDQFYPERFLSVKPSGAVTTTNGISIVTVRKLAKPVADSNDALAKGVHSATTSETRMRRLALIVLTVVAVCGLVALFLGRWKRGSQ